MTERKASTPPIECDHKCHKIGLNPWVVKCPICGCSNRDYDPSVKAPTLEELLTFRQTTGVAQTPPEAEETCPVCSGQGWNLTGGSSAFSDMRDAQQTLCYNCGGTGKIKKEVKP